MQWVLMFRKYDCKQEISGWNFNLRHVYNGDGVQHNRVYATTVGYSSMAFDWYRKWQDYVYIQCEYKSTKQKIKHLLREENKVKENKIS